MQYYKSSVKFSQSTFLSISCESLLTLNYFPPYFPPAPPQIVVSPGHTHTAISDAHTTLTLACIAHSSSHIYWTQNDLEISTDDRRSVASDLVTRGGRSFVRGVLKVCGVGVTDSGEYSCVASGDGETTTATFDLCAVGELIKAFRYQ